MDYTDLSPQNWVRGAILTLLLLLPSLLLAQSPPRYTVTDLGTLGGQECVATGINNKGQIVGSADSSVKGIDGEYITYVYVRTNGVKNAFRTLNGKNAYALAMNDNDVLVGAYSAHPLTSQFSAAEFVNGKPKLLGGFPANIAGFSISQAEAINSRGQVVGVSNNQAFLWVNGHLKKLPAPTGFQGTEARAISDSGQVAGKGDKRVPAGLFGTPYRSHALLWDAKGHVQDLGVLPGFTESIGRAINNQGEVVGWNGVTLGTRALRLTLHYHAFAWRNGKMRDLGSLPGIPDSKAAALNDKGQIVGNCYYKTDERALLWQGGRIYELNKLVQPHSGWLIQNALGINNNSVIIGNGIHNGIRRAYVMMPVR